MKRLIFLLVMFMIICNAVRCTREYSCEGCRGDTVQVPPVDTIQVPVDTVYNELITSCDITIEDNSEVRAIYPQFSSKYHSATYWIFETIPMDNTVSSTYKKTYNIGNYLPLSEKYYKGDTFYVRYEIRYKFIPSEYVQLDTLIY